MESLGVIEYFIEHYKFYGTLFTVLFSAVWMLRTNKQNIDRIMARLDKSDKYFKELFNETKEMRSDIRSLSENKVRIEEDIKNVHRDINTLETKVEDNTKSISRIEGKLSK